MARKTTKTGKLGKTKKAVSAKKKPAKASKKQQPNKDEEQVPQWFSITEIEQLNAISKPIRQKILAEFAEEPRTTKQVAEKLGEPVTRLYHHVDALAKNGFLVLEREVPKRGTTEKYFRAVARQFRVDQSCLMGPQLIDENSRLVAQLVEEARTGLLAALSRAAGGDEKHTTAVSGLVQTTESGIEKLSESLLNLVTRTADKPSSGSKKEEATNYRVMVLIYQET